VLSASSRKDRPSYAQNAEMIGGLFCAARAGIIHYRMRPRDYSTRRRIDADQRRLWWLRRFASNNGRHCATTTGSVLPQVEVRAIPARSVLRSIANSFLTLSMLLNDVLVMPATANQPHAC